MAEDLAPSELERQAQLAIACQRSDASRTIVGVKVGLDSSRTSIEVAEIAASSSIRTADDLAVYQSQYQATIQTADVQYQAAVLEAGWRSYEIGYAALYQSNTITQDALYQTQSIDGISKAQSNQISRSASIDATAEGSLATVQSTQITSEGAIDVSRISRLAAIQAQATASEAQIQSDGGVAVATIQASQLTTEASIDAGATLSIATLQASATSSEASIRAIETASVTTAEVTGIQVDAYWQAKVTREGSLNRQRGDLGEVTQRVFQIFTESQIRYQSAIDIALLQAKYAVYDASMKLKGIKYAADQDYVGLTFQADRSAELVRYRSDEQATTEREGADTSFRTSGITADNELAYRTSVANTELTEEEYRADAQYQTDVISEDRKTALLAAKVAYLQKKWDDLYPKFQATQNASVRTPGFVSSLPRVSCRGVYTVGQVQAMGNIALANADARAAGDLRSARLDAQGRGVSVASPALESERLRIYGDTARAVAAAIAGVSVETGKANAAAVLTGQKIRSNQFLDQQQAYLEAEAHAVRLQVGLLDEMARIVGEV